MTLRPRLLAAAAAATIGLGPQAQAQMLVHDPAAVAQLIGQAQTALSQLERLREQVGQAQRLYGSLNDLSNVNGIARELLAPELRQLLPEIDKLQAAAEGDLAALGGLAERAQAIRDANRIHAPTAPSPTDAALERSGARAARDLALGEKVVEASAERAAGFEALNRALDTAANARAVMDIQARLGAEQALLQNDQLRVQGLLMIQAAEARLEFQRQKEAAEAARAERMAMYRRGFAQP